MGFFLFMTHQGGGGSGLSGTPAPDIAFPPRVRLLSSGETFAETEETGETSLRLTASGETSVEVE